MKFYELVQESRSIRSFRADSPLSADDLRQLVELARLCPAARNLQVLKYRLVYEADEVAALLAQTKWAAALSQKLPPEGHGPGGFIVICHDTTLAPMGTLYSIDVGIVAQTMMLGAREKGLGGCIIGSAKAETVSELLSLPAHLSPVLILGLGVPEETVQLTEVKDGSIRYYRDENNVHYVPKRSLDELIIS